jgi:hypothetical protein
MFRILKLHNRHLLSTMQHNGTYIYMVTYSDIVGRYHGQKGAVVLSR